MLSPLISKSYCAFLRKNKIVKDYLMIFVPVKDQRCRTRLSDQQRRLLSQVNSVQHGDRRPDDQDSDHQCDRTAHVGQGLRSSSEERRSAWKQVYLDCQHLEHIGLNSSESSEYWARYRRIVSLQIKQSCPEHDHSVFEHRSSKSLQKRSKLVIYDVSSTSSGIW